MGSLGSGGSVGMVMGSDGIVGIDMGKSIGGVGMVTGKGGSCAGGFSPDEPGD